MCAKKKLVAGPKNNYCIVVDLSIITINRVLKNSFKSVSSLYTLMIFISK